MNTIPAWSNVRAKRGILTEKEVQDFIDLVLEEGKKSAAQAIPATHIAALVAVLYSYGCRISEAMELTRKDVVVDNRYVWANFRTKKKLTKEPDDPTKQSKPIPHTRNLNVRIDAPFIDYLLDHLQTLSSPDEKLFKFHKVVAQRKINWVYGQQKDKKEASMEDTNLWCHLFRDTALTQLARAGASPYQLMTWAGWSSLQPAIHYIERSEQMTEGLDDLRNSRGFMRPTIVSFEKGKIDVTKTASQPVEEPKVVDLPKPIEPEPVKEIPIEQPKKKRINFFGRYE